MKLSILTAGALALGLAAAGAVQAQPAGASAVMQACQADLAKVCPDAKPGPGGGLRECIRGHFSDLSDGCKQALMAMRAAHQQQAPATNSPSH
jgi:hypothetical protein